jgi:predicted N-acetyltransferase YhbS
VTDTVVREMDITEVMAAQEVLQRAFAEAQRQRTGRVPGPPFGSRLAQSRFQKDPQLAFVALRGGRVVGCAFAVRWGRLAWLGPLAVAPEAQGIGIGRRLVDAVHARFRRGRIRLSGLETYADSAQHMHLYTELGYQPVSVGVGFLADAAALPLPRGYGVSRFRQLTVAERDAALRRIRAIADEVVPGVDPTIESSAAVESDVGDTLLVSDRRGISGFAVAHWTSLLRPGEVLTVPVGAVARRAGVRGLTALLRALRALAQERQLARVWVRVAGRRLRAQTVLRREGFAAEVATLRMKRGPDEERASQLFLDSWL